MNDVPENRALRRLAALPLFAALDASDLTLLVESLVRRVQVGRGALLALQGEYSRTAFLLDRGTARLLRVESDGVERVVRELKPGQMVGQGALFVGESRDATLEATGEATCFTLEGAEFEAFCERHPDIAARLAPREEIRLKREAPRLRWQRADEVLLRRGRLNGWALTTRRLVHQDLLGLRQVTLRRVTDVRARHAFPLGRALNRGRVEIDHDGGGRMVWPGVSQPQRLADLIFAQVGLDQARAQAEARSRARRALDLNLPPEPPAPAPFADHAGQSDWLASGLRRLSVWLSERLLPEAHRPPPPPGDAPTSRSSRESPL